MTRYQPQTPIDSAVLNSTQPGHAPNLMIRGLLQKLEQELECAGGGGETFPYDGLDPEKV